MAKHHEWEDSRSGIRKHYKKILYPTMGVALVGTTTAAVALPIMIKNIATKKTMDILSKILPIGGPENSLKDNEWVQKKDGRVNYVAIGDSVTAGYNGFMSRNNVIQDDVLKNPYHAFSANPGAEESKPEASNVVALTNELKQIEADLKTATGDAKTALEQRKAFISLYMEDHAQHTTSDYLSYADFVANSLAKNQAVGKDGKPIFDKNNKPVPVLNDYRNFALTGATVPNLRQTLMRNTTALAAVQNADLISLSIGANDLLAAVEVLRLGWNAIRGQVETDRVSQFNAARDAINAITEINSATQDDNIARHDGPNAVDGWRTASASGYASEWDTKDLIKKSFNKLVNMLEQGTLGGLFDIQQQLLDAIFDLIQLDVATAVNEIHKAAPDAKIIVMGYAFPFHLLPKTLTDSPIFQYNEKAISTDRSQSVLSERTFDGKQATLKDIFMHTVSTIKETVERANYVHFFDINLLKEFHEGSDIVHYKLEGDSTVTPAIADKVVEHDEWYRVMPNPLDIHPSTYGHQVIAGYLSDWILHDLGHNVDGYVSVQKLDAAKDASKISSLEAIYTYAGVDKNFDIRDEKVAYDSANLISVFDKLNNPETLKSVGDYAKDYLDPQKIADHYNDVMNLISDSTLTNSQKIDKAMDVIKTLVKAEKLPLVTVVVDTIKHFVDIDALTNNFDKVTSAVSDEGTTSEKITRTLDALKLVVKSTTPIGNAGKTLGDLLDALKPMLTASDWSKMPDDISDFVMTLANDQYGVGTTKITEAIFGLLIYISSKDVASRTYSDGTTKVGHVDTSTDTNIDLIRSLIVELTKVIPITSTSMSDTIVTQLFAMPLLGGGFKLQTGEMLPFEPKPVEGAPKFMEVPDSATEVKAAEAALNAAKATGNPANVKPAAAVLADAQAKYIQSHDDDYSKYLKAQAAFEAAQAKYKTDYEAYTQNFNTFIPKLLDEIASVSKSLGFDISGAVPGTDDLKTEYLLNILNGSMRIDGGTSWLIEDLQALHIS